MDRNRAQAKEKQIRRMMEKGSNATGAGREGASAGKDGETD